MNFVVLRKRQIYLPCGVAKRFIMSAGRSNCFRVRLDTVTVSATTITQITSLCLSSLTGGGSLIFTSTGPAIAIVSAVVVGLRLLLWFVVALS